MLVMMLRNHLKFRAHHLASQFPLGTHLHLELQKVVAGHLLGFGGGAIQIPKQVLKGWAISWANKAILIPGCSLYVLQLSNSICRVQSVTYWRIRKKYEKVFASRLISCLPN